MIDKRTRAEEAAQLRHQAEMIYRENTAPLPAKTEALSPEKNQEKLFELGVHQIELELQNEELRRSQAELDMQRARYFDLYNLAPVGYLTLNEKGLIMEANLTATGMLGMERSKLVYQPLSRYILREDQDNYYWMLKQILLSRKQQDFEKKQDFELRMLKHDPRPGSVRVNAKDFHGAAEKNRTMIWVHLTVSIVQDFLTSSAGPDARGLPAFRVVLIEVTERKQAQEALLESEEKHRFLIENNHDIIYTLTKDGIFTFVSPAWTIQLGHPLNQVLGQSFQPFIHPDDVAKCLEWLQKLIRTGLQQESIEYRVRHMDGSWY